MGTNSKKYMSRWKEKNKNYFSEYYINHKEEMQQRYKNYINKFKGYYLYIITDRANNILYVGETTNIKRRLYVHLSCNSNIAEQMEQGTWKYIKYLNVSNFVNSEEELLMLENALIELYQPEWNKTKNNIEDVNRQRELELLSSLHSLLNVWEIYATNPD